MAVKKAAETATVAATNRLPLEEPTPFIRQNLSVLGSSLVRTAEILQADAPGWAAFLDEFYNRLDEVLSAE